MSHARPEYAIVIAILGVLLAMGIPSLRHGQFISGSLCIGLAAALAGWSVVAILRSRE
ncbi:MAG: hypothetical protein HC889_02970 [Synechococcaceae cyanobacterium SM1_2_3]|nr:hypothetical protein [Synechococcaceae cyanobacterium SM1_2_3]